MARQPRKRARAPLVEAPLYQRVVDALRQDIIGGRAAVGDRLPAEDALSRRFGVSRHTVREALRTLREEGIIESRQGAASTVVRPAARPLYSYSVSSIEELLQYATEARYAVDRSGIVVADHALAERLDGAVGQRWLRVEGYRYIASQPDPVCWTEVFVRADYAGIALMIGRRTGTIYSWIEEMYGVRVGSVEQVLKVKSMPGEIANTLHAETDSMAVAIRRAYRLTDGEMVEVAFNLHSATGFSYSVNLHRRG